MRDVQKGAFNDWACWLIINDVLNLGNNKVLKDNDLLDFADYIKKKYFKYNKKCTFLIKSYEKSLGDTYGKDRLLFADEVKDKLRIIFKVCVWVVMRGRKGRVFNYGLKHDPNMISLFIDVISLEYGVSREFLLSKLNFWNSNRVKCRKLKVSKTSYTNKLTVCFLTESRLRFDKDKNTTILEDRIIVSSKSKRTKKKVNNVTLDFGGMDK